jgi:hypothetical protein
VPEGRISEVCTRDVEGFLEAGFVHRFQIASIDAGAIERLPVDASTIQIRIDPDVAAATTGGWTCLVYERGTTSPRCHRRAENCDALDGVSACVHVNKAFCPIGSTDACYATNAACTAVAKQVGRRCTPVE